MTDLWVYSKNFYELRISMKCPECRRIIDEAAIEHRTHLRINHIITTIHHDIFHAGNLGPNFLTVKVPISGGFLNCKNHPESNMNYETLKNSRNHQWSDHVQTGKFSKSEDLWLCEMGTLYSQKYRPQYFNYKT